MLPVRFDVWMIFLQNTHLIQYVSERWIFSIGTWLAHVLMFWGFNAFLLVCRSKKWFEECRIDPQANPPDELKNSCLQKLILEHLTQPFLLYLAYPYFVGNGLIVYGPLPSWQIILRDLIISGLCNDILFYFGHRLLHYGAFYKHIHKKHHEFKATIGIASEYAHPVEEVFANLIPTLIGPFMMGSHVVVLWIWLMYRIYETVDTHSGYLFRYSISSFLPFTGGRERHYFHHSHNMGCFGAIWLDSLLGTDTAFLDYQKKKSLQKEEATNKRSS